MKQIILTLALALAVMSFTEAQNLPGKVYGINGADTTALSGAIVQWQGMQHADITDENGDYDLTYHHHLPHQVIVNFVGYATDSIEITSKENGMMNFYLLSNSDLESVVVEGGVSTTDIDPFAAQKLEILSNKELLKAACCNLSESFENNATIDVSYNDAVTGSKQISLLGLDGTYTQFNWENMPLIRGLGEYYGLSFIPGTWIESIQVGKGAGSVINGYESMAGQINVELQKPDKMDALFINGNTKGGQINLFNRWKYVGKDNLRSQFGVKYLHDEQIGGQLGFDQKNDVGSSAVYGVVVESDRIEAFAKNGLIFPDKPYKSMGFIINASSHEQNGWYGNQRLESSQQSVYANLINQTIIGNTNHTLRYGGNFQFDDIEEQFIETKAAKEVMVPGAFVEYNYNNNSNINLVAGIRADHLNTNNNLEISPRVHFKLNTDGDNSIRLSAGRGFRVPTLFADNPNVLVSSREVIYNDIPQIEQSWNYGANLTRYFRIAGRDGMFSTDFYRTEFQQQLVADRFTNANQVIFGALNGESFSNSFQAQVDYEVVDRFDVRMAYKRDNVQQSINGTLIEKALVPRERGLLNLAYALPFDRMKFDLTGQFVGKQRLPSTFETPNALIVPAYSEEYFRLIGQVNRKVRNWEIYVGGENLTNFRQENPIIGANDPFGSDFDASVIWGPIQGPNIYAGFRYTVKNKENEK